MPSPRSRALFLSAALVAGACSKSPASPTAASSSPTPTSTPSQTSTPDPSSNAPPTGAPPGNAPPACDPAPGSAFCWLNPLPQGSTLAGLWASSATDAWAVGPRGAMVRWDSGALTLVPVPTSAPLRAIWGSAPDDVWAAGDAVLHFDGRTWTAAEAPEGSWTALHGLSRGEVWMVGAGGAAARFDGTAWRAVATGSAEDLAAVAVAAPGEVWVATARGGTLHSLDGAAFQPAGRIALRTTLALLAAGGDVWAAGEPEPAPPRAPAQAALFHLTGGAWAPMPVAGLEGSALSALSGSAGDLWAAGVDASGHGLTVHLAAGAEAIELLPSPALRVHALQAVPGGALATGEGGQVFVRGPGGWAAVHRSAASGYLQSATVAPSGTAWFAAILPDFSGARPETQVLRVTAGKVEAVPVGVADPVYGIFALADDDVWAGSLRNGFLHFDGQAWSSRAGGFAGLVDGVWASGPGDVWGISGDAALRWDGAAVTRLPFPRGSARRIFGLSPRDVWAVGAAGVVHHWDGAAWTTLDVPGLVLAVWASAADDVWMVGEAGLALRWDGNGFARVETGTAAALRAVGGASRGEPWAAGDGGAVLRLEAGSFVPVASGTSNALAAVAAAPGGRVYVAGDQGTILLKAR
jgi:hypothetical protein